MPEHASTIADAIGVLLQRGVRARLYERIVEDVHPAITAINYPIISGVDRYGPITATNLGAELGLDRSFVSRHGALLTQAGLLTGTQDPGDARATPLALTRTGEEIVRLLRQRLQDSLDELLRTWSANDRRHLTHLLPRFAEALATAERTGGA
jgi:DNA-binding MarR family transcriptional regulator